MDVATPDDAEGAPEEPAAGRTPPRRRSSVPLPRGTTDQKLPPVAWVVVAASVLLVVAGGMFFVFNLESSEDATGWLVLGGVLALGGLGGIALFFDKWGKL